MSAAVVASVVSHGQRDLLEQLPRRARARRRAGARVREHPRRQRRARALARLPRLHQRAPAQLRAEPERADRGDERALRARPQSRRAARARLRGGAARPRRGARALRGRRAAPARERTATLQRSRRRFPTVGGTLVRRTPLRAAAARCRGSPARSLPRGPARRARWSATGCSAPACSCAARCSTRSAASTRASRCTARTSSCSTARARAGWERWYVPGRRRDARVPARHRPHVPLAAHVVAPARHGALRAPPPRDARPLVISLGAGGRGYRSARYSSYSRM